MKINQNIATTATVNSLQSCPTLCNPVNGSPPGSPVTEILQARTLEWVAISFTQPQKNYEIMPFVAIWMQLEIIIILSVVSQNEKVKYHTISFICGN